MILQVKFNWYVWLNWKMKLKVNFIGRDFQLLHFMLWHLSNSVFRDHYHNVASDFEIVVLFFLFLWGLHIKLGTFVNDSTSSHTTGCSKANLDTLNDPCDFDIFNKIISFQCWWIVEIYYLSKKNLILKKKFHVPYFLCAWCS